MNELSLFTGAGGGVLASILLGWRVVGYVEYDEYCKKIIRQRIKDGIYDDAPIFGDIRGFDGRPFRGVVDIVTAGFPCQPFSIAGKRAGADDERNMWPETLRIIREVRPRLAFLENVPGLISSGYFETILCDLAESGYDAEWCVLGADDVGAPHRRKRLWILAYATSCRQLRAQEPQDDGADNARGGRRDADNAGQDVADTGGDRGAAGFSGQEPGQEGNAREPINQGHSGRITWWDTDPADVRDTDIGCGGQRMLEAISGESSPDTTGSGRERGRSVEPRLGRVAHGVAHRVNEPQPDASRYIPRVATGVRDRVNRLKAIGNGQVPLQAVAAWAELSQRIHE